MAARCAFVSSVAENVLAFSPSRASASVRRVRSVTFYSPSPASQRTNSVVWSSTVTVEAARGAIELPSLGVVPLLGAFGAGGLDGPLCRRRCP